MTFSRANKWVDSSIVPRLPTLEPKPWIQAGYSHERYVCTMSDVMTASSIQHGVK